MPLLSSSLKSFYILDLTERNPEIWTDPNQGKVHLMKRSSVTRNAYLWDMHLIGKTQIANRGADQFMILSSFDPHWHVMWVANLEDDAGTDVYKPLPTPFAVSSFNHPVSEKFVYKGGFSFSPLITTAYLNGNGDVSALPETIDGESALYRLVLYPAMPFFVGSSVDSYNHYGPVFISDMTFSVTGEGSLPPVDIHVSYEGGKIIMSDIMPAVQPYVTVSDPNTNSSDPNNPPDPNDPFDGESYLPYRTATMQDCLVGFGAWVSISQMAQDLAPYISGEIPNPFDPTQESVARIIGFELNIQQAINFQAPQQSPDLTIEQGPRWCCINDRVVKGSITLFCREDLLIPPTSGSITMYFGGPFFFPMQNVDWQRPKQSLKAGNGYTHTFEFTARAADNAISRGFGSAGNAPVSEFAINTNGTSNIAGGPIGGGLTF